MRSDVLADDIVCSTQGPSSLFELRRARFDRHARPCHAQPKAKRGGARRDRTDDLMLAKHALSQLSYGPMSRSAPKRSARLRSIELHRAHFASPYAAAPCVAEGEAWWAWEDLNFRPHAYQARALTN